MNDFLGLCIFDLQNLDGILQLSELRLLRRESDYYVFVLAHGLVTEPGFF